jgi:hypothetical protein
MRVQRSYEVVDKGETAPYYAIINEHVASADDAWLDLLRKSARIHLRIEIEARPQGGELPRQEGLTVVTHVNGQAVKGVTLAPDEWFTRLRGAKHVDILVHLFPKASDPPGTVLGYLIHELELHAQPIAEGLRQLEMTPPKKRERAATNILSGEDIQHSNPVPWNAYLDRGLEVGNRQKARGQAETGSDVIFSVVNDVMTRMKTPGETPGLTDEQRQALLGRADAIGKAEGEDVNGSGDDDDNDEQHSEIDS